MVILAKPRSTSLVLLSWTRVQSYNHESFSVQKRKDTAAKLRSRTQKRFRILYHEAQRCWIIAMCEDPMEVWNDWCYVLQQPRFQCYAGDFVSPECAVGAVPDAKPETLVTQHKFVRLQVRERVWCQFCKAHIFHRNAKQCIYCKFVVHDKCEDCLDAHPPMRYCQEAQTNSENTIAYPARLCVKGKDTLKGVTHKEALFEVHPRRRVLRVRIAGASCSEIPIQDLEVRKSQDNRAQLRLYTKKGEGRVDLAKGGKFEMMSAAECENFCSTLELLDPDRPESNIGENTEPCSLYIFTWNMGNKPPDEQTLKEAFPASGYDLIVVGVQECDYAPRGASRSTEMDWFWTLEKMLEDNYIKIAGLSLRYIRLLIFAAKDKARKITKVIKLSEATGIGGVVGNKGGIGISVQYAQSRLCFITSHLAAHQDHLDSRRRDYCDIIGGLSSRLSTAKHLDVLHAFDYLFWFGDLNYRLDMERAEVMRCIQANEIPRLLAADQLVREMKEMHVFQSFETSAPTFNPTYKYVPGKYPREYETTKMRIPSYTDRVLWRSHVKGGVTPLELQSLDRIITSDHSPVAQRFVVQARRQFILADDAFATRRALRLQGLTAHNVAHFWAKVKFFSGNLDGKWQTQTSKTFQWGGAGQTPLLPCILGVPEFIAARPLFMVMWDVNTNRSRGQAVVYLDGLRDSITAAFEVPLLHEGSCVGSLTGKLSMEEIVGDEDFDTPIPALRILGDADEAENSSGVSSESDGTNASEPSPTMCLAIKAATNLYVRYQPSPTRPTQGGSPDDRSGRPCTAGIATDPREGEEPRRNSVADLKPVVRRVLTPTRCRQDSIPSISSPPTLPGNKSDKLARWLRHPLHSGQLELDCQGQPRSSPLPVTDETSPTSLTYSRSFDSCTRSPASTARRLVESIRRSPDVVAINGYTSPESQAPGSANLSPDSSTSTPVDREEDARENEHRMRRVPHFRSVSPFPDPRASEKAESSHSRTSTVGRKLYAKVKPPEKR